MAIVQELPKSDPLARAMPGQSFTETPGLRPYEKPAMSSNPEEIIDTLEESLKQEDTQQKIVDMLEVNVSAETISDALMMKCFTEGMCTPDVAELVKPAIFMIVVQIGTDNNVEDIMLFNSNEEEVGMDESQKLALMRQTSPEKFQALLRETQSPDIEEIDEEELDNILENDFLNEMSMEDEPMEDMGIEGSFLDMDETSELSRNQQVDNVGLEDQDTAMEEV